MAQSLYVNGKRYVPSTELAKRFNYTSDYISKLARDEKILGTRIGRQWFIEPESLHTYIQQLEVEKRIKQEQLSRERKVERETKALSESASRQPVSLGPAVVAAGQSLAVVLCGALIGVMALMVYANGLQTNDIARGVNVVTERVVSKVSVGFMGLAQFDRPDPTSAAAPFFSREAQSLAMVGVGPQHDTSGVYTVFPQSTSTTETDAPTIVTASSTQHQRFGHQLPFSDEVEVAETDGVLQVRPVFKDSVGNAYELSATSEIPQVARQ